MTNEILLLVGAVAAMVVAGAEAEAAGDGGEDWEAAFAPFVQELWWECAVAPAGSDPDALKATLRQLCIDSSKLLREAFGAVPGGEREALEEKLSAEFFGRAVGMFEQNQLGVRVGFRHFTLPLVILSISANSSFE